MSREDQLRALAVKAQAIVDAAGDNPTDEHVKQLNDIQAESSRIAGEVERRKQMDSVMSGMSGFMAGDNDDSGSGSDASGSTAGDGIGARFVKSAAFRAFRKAHPTGIGSGTPIRIDAKGIGNLADLGVGTKATITTGTGNAGPVREPGYRSNLDADDSLTFLDLITYGNTEIAYSEYAQVISENNNAAVVAEGELKPVSDVTTELVESKAYTYADGFDVTNQTLADDGALVAFMESRIRRHVLGVVHEKIINGAGAGTEPTGILNTTGTLAQAFDTDVVTTLARALERFEEANDDLEPQAIVMRSSDVWNMRLLKDSNGQYLLGNPLQQGPIPTPWGVPLVPSNKLPAGTALVGRFDSVNFLELEPLNVLAFNQHKDYAQRNMAYVRAEMRGRQLFYSPREVVVATVAGA